MSLISEKVNLTQNQIAMELVYLSHIFGLAVKKILIISMKPYSRGAQHMARGPPVAPTRPILVAHQG